MPAFVELPPVPAGPGLLVQPADLPAVCPVVSLRHPLRVRPIRALR